MNKLCFLQHRARLKIASRVEKEGETNRRRWWKNCGHKYGMTVCVVKDVELRLVMNCLLYIKIKFPFSLWVSSNFDQDILFLKKKKECAKCSMLWNRSNGYTRSLQNEVHLKMDFQRAQQAWLRKISQRL